MTDIARDSAATSAIKLLTHYGFEQGEFTSQQLVDQWIQAYPLQWVHLALVEALYQGRYKAVSVGQILAFWHRRGRPIYRFDREFERLICDRFPKKLWESKDKELATPTVERGRRGSKQARQATASIDQARVSKDLSSYTSDSNSSSDSAAILTRLPSASPHTAQPDQSDQDVDQAETLTQNTPLPVSASSHSLKSRQRKTARQAAPSQSMTQVEQELSPVEASTRPLGEAESTYQAWSGLRQYSIHQFVPHSEPSDFYTKLTAIAVGASHAKS